MASTSCKGSRRFSQWEKWKFVDPQTNAKYLDRSFLAFYSQAVRSFSPFFQIQHRLARERDRHVTTFKIRCNPALNILFRRQQQKEHFVAEADFSRTPNPDQRLSSSDTFSKTRSEPKMRILALESGGVCKQPGCRKVEQKTKDVAEFHTRTNSNTNKIREA